MNPEEICSLKDLIGAPFIGLYSDTGRRNHHLISKKKMQIFKAASTNPEFCSHYSFYFRGDDSDQNQTHFTDLGELEQSAAAFPHDDAVVLSPSSMFSLKANNVGGVPDSLHYGTWNVGGCLDIGSTITGTGGGGCVDTGQQQKGTTTSGNGQFKN